MNTLAHHRSVQLGTLSFANPLLWVIAALLGFLLLSSWPELAAKPAQAQAAPVAGADATPAAIYVSSDPSLPSAASVFAGRPYEASQQIDGF